MTHGRGNPIKKTKKNILKRKAAAKAAQRIVVGTTTKNVPGRGTQPGRKRGITGRSGLLRPFRLKTPVASSVVRPPRRKPKRGKGKKKRG